MFWFLFHFMIIFFLFMKFMKSCLFCQQQKEGFFMRVSMCQQFQVFESFMALFRCIQPSSSSLCFACCVIDKKGIAFRMFNDTFSSSFDGIQFHFEEASWQQCYMLIVNLNERRKDLLQTLYDFFRTKSLLQRNTYCLLLHKGTSQFINFSRYYLAWDKTWELMMLRNSIPPSNYDPGNIYC